MILQRSMMLDITSPHVSLEIPVKPTEFWHSEQALFGCVPPFTHDVLAKAVRLALPPMLREPRDGKPTRLLSLCEVLPAGRRSCSWPIGEATWPWSHRAAILSAVYPVARLWG